MVDYYFGPSAHELILDLLLSVQSAWLRRQNFSFKPKIVSIFERVCDEILSHVWNCTVYLYCTVIWNELYIM